jgi:hypothetical protein
MAYFAKLGTGNIVENVIAVSNLEATTEEKGQEFINNTYQTNDIWKQTSYNTRGGKYYNSDNTLGDQSKAFRKNYAGKGYTYDENRNAFIPPKQYDSWILNEDTCRWEPPIPYPTDGKMYYWNEETLSWDLLDNS